MKLPSIKTWKGFKQTTELLEERERERQEPERQRREEQERELLEAMPPAYVVTLVHGTQLSRRLFEPLVSLFKWPRGLYRELQDGPPWIQRSSPLAEDLRKALGWRVRIEPFPWKAYNGVHARAVATEQLRAKLYQLQKDYPNAEQVIIAHSHGGNVAFSALTDRDDARRILGVATLATPFLIARSRYDEGLLDVGDAVAAALMAGFATLAIGLAMDAGWSWWNWAIVVSVSVALLMLGGVWVTKKMRQTAWNIKEKMKETKLDPEQVTVVRTSGDEAVAVITGARVTGAFVDLVWQGFSEPVLLRLSALLKRMNYLGLPSVLPGLLFPSVLREYDKAAREVAQRRTTYSALVEDSEPPPPKKPFSAILASYQPSEKPLPWPEMSLTYQPPEKLLTWEKIKEEIKKAALPWVGPLIVTIIVTIFQDPKYAFLKWAILGIAALYGLPALLALLVTVINVIPGIVFSIGLLPIGWTVPFAGHYLDVTAEPAPTGTWRVTQFDRHGEKGFAHSKSYDDPRVHKHLATWIKQRAQAKQKEAEKPCPA